VGALDPEAAKALLAHAALLDCRDEAAFAAGHLCGSGHIPALEFEARRHELPPRDAGVPVVGASGTHAAVAAAALEALGYARVAWLDAPAAALAAHGWDQGPAAPLWRPSPWLAARVASIPRGRALDIAAGAGREAVFLALAGFAVEAVDRAPEALARARALAVRNGVTLATREVDLEARGARLPGAGYALVTVFRFLHRPLLPALTSALAPGGHLVYETFMRGQERHGRPTQPRFLLQRGELERAFPSLEILAAEESDPPGGPVMARLHARLA
jgi:SAM-dependent methyltransferase